MGLVSLTLFVASPSLSQVQAAAPPTFPESEVLNGPGIDYVPKGSLDFVPKKGPIVIGKGSGVAPPLHPAVPAKFKVPSWFRGEEAGTKGNMATNAAAKKISSAVVEGNLMGSIVGSSNKDEGNSKADPEGKPWAIRGLKNFADDGLKSLSEASDELTKSITKAMPQ